MAREDSKKLQSFTSFNAGEYSPSLAGRVDLQSFGSSARLLLNFMSEDTGGIKKFYGTRHVAELENAGDILLVPFYNSYEPMCFVFSSNFIGVVLTENYFELNFRPLQTSNLRDVRWKQVNDQLFLVAEDMPMMAINFLGPEDGPQGYKFEMTALDFSYEPFFPVGWAGNYNGEIEVVGTDGAVTIRIPSSQTGYLMELPTVLRGVSQFNILGNNNYIKYSDPDAAGDYVVLGQTTVTVVRKSSDNTETVIASGIVSGAPVNPGNQVDSSSYIIAG